VQRYRTTLSEYRVLTEVNPAGENREQSLAGCGSGGGKGAGPCTSTGGGTSAGGGGGKSAAAAASGVGGSVGVAASATDDATARPWSISRWTTRVSADSCDDPTAPSDQVCPQVIATLRQVCRRYSLVERRRRCRSAASSASLLSMLTNRFTRDSFDVRFVQVVL
jgi:hypothetical protein